MQSTLYSIQRLINYSRCGMKVLATCSPHNFPLVKSYGADAVFDYHTHTDATTAIRAATKNRLRYALDCISTDSTMEFCYACLGRTGGRYVRLEPFAASLHTRPTVTPDWVIGSMVHGKEIGWPPPLAREADGDVRVWAAGWYRTVQRLLDAGRVRAHPVRVSEGWEAILSGIEVLAKGEISGEKVIVRIPQNV